MGVWHTEDTSALAAMLTREFHEQPANPFRLSQPARRPPPEDQAKFINLAEVLQLEGKKDFGTSRMFRNYQNTGEDLELLDRVDWEQPPRFSENGISSCITAERDLGKLYKLIGDDVTAVILKDLGKGVVCQPLVRWLVKHYASCKWFVSTKRWRAEDLIEQLRSVDLRLFIVPQVAAQTAIREGELSRWIVTGDGTSNPGPSLEAHRLLDDLHTNCRQRDAIVLALPGGLDVVARLPKTDKNPTLSVVGTNVQKKPLGVEVAMASVLLPALTAGLLDNSQRGTEKLIKDSVAFTRDWMLSEAQRIAKVDGVPSTPLALELPISPEQTGQWHTDSWQDSKEEWIRAHSIQHLGIVDKNGSRRIELWRAMVEVPGYVCLVNSKRIVLRRLQSELSRFVRGSRNSHASFLVTAPPGSGKTLLIRKLAYANGMQFLDFNITQLATRSALVACFDRIVTTQLENRESPVLVFIDELNATLEGNHVYDAFLSPLEDGSYVHADKTFRIDPCAWIFVGTSTPRASVEGDGKSSDKASDFESRLVIDPLHLAPMDDVNEADQIRTERIYLGAALLRAEFPDVREVSEKVLRLFTKLPTKFAVRDLRHLIKSFVDVQYGRVHEGNVPLERLAQIQSSSQGKFRVDAWSELESGADIQII